MNFFRSILEDEPDNPVTENPHRSGIESESKSSQEHADVQSEQSSPRREEITPSPNSSADNSGGWSFGGLMKTFAARSESIIETYRRDLKEFGSGLQKETATFREVASRAVKDLPASIEVGASVAQGSLQTMGHAIDGVWKSTAEIVSQGKETLLAPSDGESDSETQNYSSQSLSAGRYSRFDSQLRAIQSDVSTYSEDPEDLNDYNKWKLGFVLKERSEEVKSLIEENETMHGIYKRVVPNGVDHENFWCRYFYRVHKLKQQEDVRANLVKRAISVEDDEELTWDVDDDESEEENKGPSKSNAEAMEEKELASKELPHAVKQESTTDKEHLQSPGVADDKIESNPNVDQGNALETSSKELPSETDQASKVKDAEPLSKPDEKASLDGKADNSESCKDSDVSVVSTQPSLPEEEDLGWDEIEDLESNDEKKLTHAGLSSRADLQKRLSAAEEDDDLSWDIEDDDEPVPKPGTK